MRWMNSDKEYKRVIKTIKDIVLDLAEAALMKRIANGDTTATIFYLKCHGKERGYYY
jgi:hypothetical protein